ncbi:uncharacterized protein F5891DRAFT_986912 [Suillus fuscotomentosus]|uniref:Uncharacterized protein n=1 Tax=Suillus fuscotomentosus TaxID=1912939 RepID=A0AAD4HD83_9AGAM|nr:uncharacterized protein F5891DRAFT_986912 [Suillus fuscotomentosus]KAG1890597.1 hypothetical protein F5891DRAFT_986912 [Suillus fuscotomentosus]
MVISVYKRPVSPAIGDKTTTSKNGNIIVKRPKLDEPMYPLPPPFHQMPSPVMVKRWEAEVRHCEEAKWAQLFELVLAAHGGETYLESYDLDVIRWIHRDRPEVRTRSVPP